MRENTKNSNFQGHVRAFRFDRSNGGAPLEETDVPQGQEFLGKELSQRQLLLGVGQCPCSFPGSLLPPALQPPLPTVFLWPILTLLAPLYTRLLPHSVDSCLAGATSPLSSSAKSGCHG